MAPGRPRRDGEEDGRSRALLNGIERERESIKVERRD